MKLSFHSRMKPWYHFGVIRVAYFYTDYAMNEAAIRKIEEDLGIEITILPLYVDDLARLKEDLQRLEQQDYDIVICRGIADTCIRKIGCPLPYMPIIFSDAETLQILNRIKKGLTLFQKMKF